VKSWKDDFALDNWMDAKTPEEFVFAYLKHYDSFSLVDWRVNECFQSSFPQYVMDGFGRVAKLTRVVTAMYKSGKLSRIVCGGEGAHHSSGVPKWVYEYCHPQFKDR